MYFNVELGYTCSLGIGGVRVYLVFSFSIMMPRICSWIWNSCSCLVRSCITLVLFIFESVCEMNLQPFEDNEVEIPILPLSANGKRFYEEGLNFFFESILLQRKK